MARPRKKQTRPLHHSIYILCEGKKTEPYYFSALIDDLNFPGELAKVEVLESEKTDLVGLVMDAKKYKRNNKYGAKNDQYWIVVDRDGYTEHARGFDMARANSFKVVFSSVCFEYWFLCHFAYTTKACNKCCNVIKELEKYIKDYKKNSFDTYAITAERYQQAKKNAKRCRDHWEAVGGKRKIYELTPYTDVDILIDTLKSYKEELTGKK